ncbi:MAG: lysozyme inhibitor LprI family protein [Roseibium sp.]|uniref:lysozyme inhibitor LprI family protein n=1 Tax=Roseibium sp. TaxID=1936156 RepID=UPI003D9C665C
MPNLDVKYILLASLAFLANITSSRPMSFETVPYSGNSGTTVVRAEGTIEPGDTERFLDLLKTNPPSALILVVTSPGGSVGAALSLADAIEAREFSIIGDDECASACAQILFPAGFYSVLTPGSVLGIHSCSDTSGRNDVCNEEIAQAAVKRGFPYGTLDMFTGSYGPDEMKWITEISARCFGFYHHPDDPHPIAGRKACVDGFFFASLSGNSTTDLGPSFDCSKATTKVEGLICDDKELMLLDSILGRVYRTRRQMLDSSSQKQLVRDQRKWIDARNENCSPLIPSTPDFRSTREGALCLFKHIETRVYELIDDEMLN